MSSTDARETYEMLRAAHTLCRMAFGAVALISQPSSEQEAESITKPFDKVFKIIADAATKFLGLAELSNQEGSKELDN